MLSLAEFVYKVSTDPNFRQEFMEKLNDPRLQLSKEEKASVVALGDTLALPQDRLWTQLSELDEILSGWFWN